MGRELLLFTKSIWYGALLVLTYDILKICRNVIRHSNAFTTFEDLVYWIFCALFLFARFFKENSGILRGYLAAGIVVGSLACYFSISPVFVRFFTFLSKKVWKVLLIPLKIVKKVIKRLKSSLFQGKMFVKRKIGSGVKGLGRHFRNNNKGEEADEEKKGRQKKTRKRKKQKK